MQVPSDGMTVTFNSTTLDHYRGFFFYYCLSGSLDQYTENRTNPKGEEYPDYWALPEQDFKNNFRFQVYAEGFTQEIVEIPFENFTHTVYNGDKYNDTSFGERLGMYYDEDASRCMKYEIRGMDNIVVKSLAVPDCVPAPVGDCNQYEA